MCDLVDVKFEVVEEFLAKRLPSEQRCEAGEQRAKLGKQREIRASLVRLEWKDVSGSEAQPLYGSRISLCDTF